MKNQTLGRRITSILLLLMSLMALILGGVMYVSFRNVFFRFYNERAQDIVRIVAKRTDWESLQPYIKTGEMDDYARELKEYYDTVKENFTGVSYLYLLIPGEDHLTYVIEGQTPSDDPADICKLGDVFYYTETEYNYLLPDVKAGKPSTEVIFSDNATYGDGISVWAPVFDDSGVLRAMVEADIRMPRIRTDLNSTVARVILIFMLCVLSALLFMLFYLRRNVVRPIGRLNRSVDSYEHGDLHLELDKYRHEDEIKHLAVSFGEMTKRIEEYTHEVERVTAEKERIGAELNVATQIQADMLPRIFPAFPERSEFDLYATMSPAKEVGGDFYDFFLIDDDHLAMVMADVSGKGVPAALFMVIAKTLIKNRAQASAGEEIHPGKILANVNNQLCEGNEAELFVTVWLGILTISTGRLISASAGHEYPAFYRAGQGFALQKERHGPPLATMEGLRFRENETTLSNGDALFIYTDGVTEATSGELELFGEERMVEALNRHATETPDKIIVGVRGAIDGFVKDAPQFDDITMLCMRYEREA